MDNEDPFSTIFSNRNPLRHHDCLLFGSVESDAYIARSQCKQSVFKDSRFEFRHSLDGRGWGFQEAVLLPRTIMFGHDMVRFACRNGTLCAMYHPLDEDPRSQGSTTMMFQKHLFTQLTIRSEGRDLLEWIEDWTRLLLMYSQTQLKVNRDKLKALAGITTMERRLGLCKAALECFTNLCQSVFAGGIEIPTLN